MSQLRFLRSAIVLGIAASLFVSVSPAIAEDAATDSESETTAVAEDATYAGTYAIVATTNTGKNVSTNVVVSDVGEGQIQLQADVMGIPVTTGGEGVWNADRTEVTVPASVMVPFVAQGSGSITLIKTGGGWHFVGSGSGSAFGKSGNATAVGSKPVDWGTTPEQAAEAAGISETTQSIDDATEPLQPDTQPEIVTDDVISGMATILFVVFLFIFLEMILGVLFW